MGFRDGTLRPRALFGALLGLYLCGLLLTAWVRRAGLTIPIQCPRTEFILHALDERPSPNRYRFAPLRLPFGSAVRQGRLDPLVLQRRQYPRRRAGLAKSMLAV